jgi:hypothetical protein
MLLISGVDHWLRGVVHQGFEVLRSGRMLLISGVDHWLRGVACGFGHHPMRGLQCHSLVIGDV